VVETQIVDGKIFPKKVVEVSFKPDGSRYHELTFNYGAPELKSNVDLWMPQMPKDEYVFATHALYQIGGNGKLNLIPKAHRLPARNEHKFHSVRFLAILMASGSVLIRGGEKVKSLSLNKFAAGSFGLSLAYFLLLRTGQIPDRQPCAQVAWSSPYP